MLYVICYTLSASSSGAQGLLEPARDSILRHTPLLACLVVPAMSIFSPHHKRKSTKRPAQYVRAQGHITQALLSQFSAILHHRGNELTKLGKSLNMVPSENENSEQPEGADRSVQRQQQTKDAAEAVNVTTAKVSQASWPKAGSAETGSAQNSPTPESTFTFNAGA